MRKGQAAMEFLMTYGWAILIVVIAVAALAAFGVFNPQRFAQERCVGDSTKFACASNSIAIDTDTNVLQLDLRNGAGETVNITGVTASENGDCGVIDQSTGWEVRMDGSVVDPPELRPNDRFILAVTCASTPSEGGVFDDTFRIQYDVVGGVTGLHGSIEAVVKT